MTPTEEQKALIEGKIPVATARSVAKKHGLKQCLLIGWDGEEVHVVTYGETKADCEAAAKAQDFWTGKIREFSFRGEIPMTEDLLRTARELSAAMCKTDAAECQTYALAPGSTVHGISAKIIDRLSSALARTQK